MLKDKYIKTGYLLYNIIILFIIYLLSFEIIIGTTAHNILKQNNLVSNRTFGHFIK